MAIIITNWIKLLIIFMMNNSKTIELLEVQTGDEMTQELEAAWNLYTRVILSPILYDLMFVMESLHNYTLQ